MVQFRPKARELIAKVVYYGPPLGGKTTNLKSLYAGYPEEVRGELIIVPAGTDRTIFFDFLPLDIGTLRGMKVRVQLYTVPGQVHYNATRQVVLRSVDGIVFVADSQRPVLANNRESWENLKDNLLLQGMSLEEVPHVLQYNKRDLKDISSVAELDELLNDFNAPFFEAVASEGIGVEETLQAIVKLVIRSLRDRFRLEGEQAVTQPIYYAPEAEGDDADVEVELGGVRGDDGGVTGAPQPPSPSPVAPVFGGTTPDAPPIRLDASSAPSDAGTPPSAPAQEETERATTMADEIAFADAEGGIEVAEPLGGGHDEGEEGLPGEAEPFTVAPDEAKTEAAGTPDELVPEPDEAGASASGDAAASAGEEPEWVWDGVESRGPESDAEADVSFEAPSEPGPTFGAEGAEDDFVQPVEEETLSSESSPFEPPAEEVEGDRPRWGPEAAAAALREGGGAAPPISDEVEALAPEAVAPPDEPFGEHPTPPGLGGEEPRPPGSEPWRMGPVGPGEAGPEPFELQDLAPQPVDAHHEEAVLSEDVSPLFEVTSESERGVSAPHAVFDGAAPQPPARREEAARPLSELAALEIDALRRGPSEEGRAYASAPLDSAALDEALPTVQEAIAAEVSDPFVVAPPPPVQTGTDDVFAIVPAPPPPTPLEPESVVVPVEIAAVKHAASRALARHGEVRELEVEVPVPTVWTGGRRMTFQLRLTLVPQEEDDDR